MKANNEKITTELLKLIEIMATLRSPGGCPWDKEQTAESLKPHLLEETYELLEAIDSRNINDIRDELGDLLLQVIFLAQIFQEQQKFNLAEVAVTISNKLIRRHPHVFANASKADHTERWEQIKLQERAEQGKRSQLADRLVKNLPALKKASKIAKITSSHPPEKLIDNLQVGLEYLKQQVSKNQLTPTNSEQVLSNLLYSFVELTTALQVDAEDILRKKTIQVMAKIDAQITTEKGQELQSS